MNAMKSRMERSERKVKEVSLSQAKGMRAL